MGWEGVGSGGVGVRWWVVEGGTACREDEDTGTTAYPIDQYFSDGREGGCRSGVMDQM